MLSVLLLPVFFLPYNKANAKAESLKCMAENVYHEARGQRLGGRLAVILVTWNRVKDKRFPNTICGVVKQGPIRPSWKRNGTFFPIKHRCQFSWWCDGKSDKIYQKKVYEDIKYLVSWFMTSHATFVDFTEGALYYHAYYVTPGWAKTKTKTIRIGDHIFYRWEK